MMYCSDVEDLNDNALCLKRQMVTEVERLNRWWVVTLRIFQLAQSSASTIIFLYSWQPREKSSTCEVYKGKEKVSNGLPREPHRRISRRGKLMNWQRSATAAVILRSVYDPNHRPWFSSVTRKSASTARRQRLPSRASWCPCLILRKMTAYCGMTQRLPRLSAIVNLQRRHLELVTMNQILLIFQVAATQSPWVHK